jgi:tRNA pseudouridine55 synthase
MVIRLRRALGFSKVGHIGTLDPFATGVLPLCLGKATRLAQYLGEGEKTYDAEVRFGFATDTGDSTGKPLAEPIPVVLEETHFRLTLSRFQGTLLQKPPRFSARKVHGVPLYKYARRGEFIEPAARSVVIHEISLQSLDRDRCRLQIRCSPGTYVRALASDLGVALGYGAHVIQLRRTRSGEFELAQAMKAELLEAAANLEQIVAHIIPMEALLNAYARIELDEDDLKRIRNGARIEVSAARFPAALRSLDPIGDRKDPLLRLFSSEGRLIAIAQLLLDRKDPEKQIATYGVKPLTVLV